MFTLCYTNVYTNCVHCLKQHATMTSTMRRLGEDIFKGIVSKGNPHSSSEQSTESKSKSAAFFKSSCMPLRFLSTLIVLKTVTQGKFWFFYMYFFISVICLGKKTFHWYCTVYYASLAKSGFTWVLITCELKYTGSKYESCYYSFHVGIYVFLLIWRLVRQVNISEEGEKRCW